MYYNNLGLAYIQLNNAQEALPCFQKAIEIDPNNGIYNNDAGLAYNKLGNYQQALAYLEKAVRMEPVCDNAYYNLAEAYYNLARPQEAISVLQYYIQAQPEDAAAWAYLGVILFDQGDIYNAKESLLNARQLYSEQGNYEGIQKVEEYLKKYDQNPLLPYNY
jgi:tetratricopeptide (TPR) repeat protein